MASRADPQFHLDRERSEQDKQRRERHFHVIEVPLLRVIGFSIITLLVLLRYAFVPDSSAGDVESPWLVGVVGLLMEVPVCAVVSIAPGVRVTSPSRFVDCELRLVKSALLPIPIMCDLMCDYAIASR